MKDDYTDEMVRKDLEELNKSKRTRQDILDEYGDVMRQVLAEAAEDIKPSFQEKVFQLVNGLRIRVSEHVSELREGLAGLAAEPALAFRGADGALKGAEAADASKELILSSAGVGCAARVCIRPLEAGFVELEFSLRDQSDKPVSPFRLSIIQPDGETLMDEEIGGELYHLERAKFENCAVHMSSTDGELCARLHLQIAE
jgi:hypothetical protein